MREGPLGSSIGQTASGAWSRLLGALFGDRIGLGLFLGALVLYVASIRVSLLVNDSYTVANTLIALSRGDLYIERLWFEVGPGLHTVGGLDYGRNYGQAVLALPFLWLLQGLSALADLRVALLGAWSLLLLATIDQVGAVVGRRERFAQAGSALAVGAFLLNLAVSYPMTGQSTVVLALQLSTATAAAATPVIVYRLVSGIHDRRVGAVAGVATAVASPVGFWATYPKRHALVALLVSLVVWSFYRSRSAPGAGERVRFRALAYAVVALTAWVHAPEAFVVLLALGTVDLLTDPRLRWRRLAVVGAAFALALLPFIATNVAISGNPLRPPRLLPEYAGRATGLATEATSPAATGDASGQTGSPGLVVAIIGRFVTYVLDSVTSMLQPVRLWQVFVRSGYLPAVATDEGQLALRLSLLESMPLLGALLAAPVLATRRLRRYATDRDLSPPGPTRATDALVGSIAALYVVVYWPRLPIHASFTVRYLHPLYPLGVYALARFPAVRSVVTERPRLLAWSYGAWLLVGGQLLVVVLAMVPETFSEAYQLNAMLAAIAGGLVGLWSVVASVRETHERSGAVVLAGAAALSSVFLLLSVVVYYDYSLDYALPVLRSVSEALAFV